MATYVLKENEVEVKSTRPTWFILLSHIFITILTLFLWTPILIYVILVRATTRYVLTNQRIIWEAGILSKSSKESPLDKINNVSHSQSFLGRLFNYGNVGLQTASEMGATALKSISSPSQFKSEIVNQVDHYKKSHMAQQAKAMAEAMNNSSNAKVIEENEKKCPQCAENVKEEAQICRFCKHQFA